MVRETKLAWAPAEAIKPHLTSSERNRIFMEIGAGETFAAIRTLCESATVKQIPVQPDLVHQCTLWARAYAGHNDEQHLRRLVDEYLMSCSIPPSATIRVHRLPTKPKPRPLASRTRKAVEMGLPRSSPEQGRRVPARADK